ncbi:uncharacterized protein LOC113352516 [Papaver somniferum]|uniref:uncharacterized protein LOC113352516 n=1 Tax=Papaver somniferum TaxID=3469 RepID=UPI000E6F93AD|nr:uncharacterized protein LOC113352516 [Papaver somniferum]
MRSFTKRELIRPGDTRFATENLTLESLLESKASLEEMFTSNKWKSCSWENSSEGKAMKNIIIRDANFWSGLVYSLKATKPLVGVLRIVDSKATPAMGFIYGAVDKAKEEMARNLDNEEPKYKEIWEIIDEKKDAQNAGYFLNPQFQYEDDVSNHPEIRSGLYNCMEKLLPREDVAKAHMDLDKYLNRDGHFGRLEAETTRKLKTYGEYSN